MQGRLFSLLESPGVDEVDRASSMPRRDLSSSLISGAAGPATAASRASAAARSAAARAAAGGFVTRQAAPLVFLATAAGTGIVRPTWPSSPRRPPLYTTLLTDATLFDALLAIDQELAATAQAGGCRHCAGRLDHARLSAQAARRARDAERGLRDAREFLL